MLSPTSTGEEREVELFVYTGSSMFVSNWMSMLSALKLAKLWPFSFFVAL